MTTTESSRQTAALMPPSRWRLALQGYLALIGAVVLGGLFAAPVIYSRVRCYAETTYLCGALPADDAQLSSWGSSRPKVFSFTAERRGTNLWVRSEYYSFRQQPSFEQITGQMRHLGYEFRGMRGGSTGMASGLRDLITDPLALAVMLAGMQVALGFIGLNRVRAAARKGEPLPPLFLAFQGRAIVAGVLGGLLLLGFGLLNSFVLEALLGHSPPSPWDSSQAMPAGAKIVFLIFGALGAPITEEIFFRGYLFGKFKRAGYVWFGVLVSSALFGVVHYSDFYNVPAICGFGVFLAWLYHRTGSLLTPIIAHAVNNGVLIVSMTLS